jgi:lipid II isoglutaminyl synthase (glutamine-hydrolysing)
MGRVVVGDSHAIRLPSGARSLRRVGARTVARGLRSAVRLVGAGAGTSAPGLVLERLDPSFLKSAASGSRARKIMVAGSNGKTTTTAMVRHILRSQGWSVAGNESGSNMTRGVTTTFLDVTDATDYIVLEVDEAVAPYLVRTLQPDVLVLTNVFRDQLDRFGEAESVAALLGRAGEAMPPTAHLVVNRDDPLLVYSVRNSSCNASGFGLVQGAAQTAESFSSEPQICPRCGHNFSYSFRTLGHLGAGTCVACGWSNNGEGTKARILESRGLDGVNIDIDGHPVRLSVGGTHAAYNAAASVAATGIMGVPALEACTALQGFVPRFGRDEVVDIDGRKAHVLLMKNPAGANAVIDEACSDPQLAATVIAVNDRAADGRDISWIWDADFESLVESGATLIPSGRRANDVAVRIKYAGGKPESAVPNVAAAMRQAAGKCRPNEKTVVFATYTAMLELRRGLTRARRLRRVEALR